MSDEQRITKVVKEKDPKRVEAGKRLGAMSKAAKERKAREREESRETTEHRDDDDNESGGGGIGTATLLTCVGVLTGLVCLYYTYKQDKRAEQQVDSDGEQKQSVSTTSTTTTKQSVDTTKPKLRSFD